MISLDFFKLVNEWGMKAWHGKQDTCRGNQTNTQNEKREEKKDSNVRRAIVLRERVTYLKWWNVRVGNVAMHILYFWEVFLRYVHQLRSSDFIGEPREAMFRRRGIFILIPVLYVWKEKEEMGIQRKAEKTKGERAERKPTIHCRAKCNNVMTFSQWVLCPVRWTSQ